MSATHLRQLTKSAEKRITEDWQRELPGLSVYRPRHLLRRLGPLLIGVCLDRDSGGEKYKPCFHVHFLGKDFPTVSLTMCTQLRSNAGGPDYIEVRFHEQRYQQAISRLMQQSPLPVEGPVTIEQVIGAYRKHAETPLGQRQAAILYADCIMLLSWCGREVEARRFLDETIATMRNEQVYQPFGSREEFRQKMLDAIEHPDEIKNTIDAQAEALGVDNLQAEELMC